MTHNKSLMHIRSNSNETCHYLCTHCFSFIAIVLRNPFHSLVFNIPYNFWSGMQRLIRSRTEWFFVSHDFNKSRSDALASRFPLIYINQTSMAVPVFPPYVIYYETDGTYITLTFPFLMLALTPIFDWKSSYCIHYSLIYSYTGIRYYDILKK